ncbi:MAG: hypothetical protein L0Y64_08385 [Myxococcaceae bacterium]|nr:hypothetical protein [Myxococcaceae bacterium]
MRREDVEGFLGKGWERLEQLDAEHWRTQAERHGEEFLLAAADQLRLQMKAQWPDWPTEEERAEDLAHHIRLTAALARVHLHDR